MSEKDFGLPWHSPQFYRQVHAIAEPRVRFSEHQGTRILMVDFTRAELQLVRAVAAECLHVMASQPLRSVLSLVEVEGIPFHTDALKIGSELVERGQTFALRTAVSGVTGFRHFMLQTIAQASSQPIRLFKERASALEWLLNGDAKA